MESKKEVTLQHIQSLYTRDRVHSYLHSLKDSKVLVIGDGFFDEYAYGQTMDRAKKEPILVFKHKQSEIFAGSVFIMANHLAEFSQNVSLLTVVGRDQGTAQILSEKLNPMVKKILYYDLHSPTLVKRRYIDHYRNQKLFQVYNRDPEEIRVPEQEIISFLEEQLPLYDVVIVADFGHGTITPKIQEVLERKSNFLAVNVQTNSGNFGFNIITKFRRANYISITQEELQLAMQDKSSGIEDLIDKLRQKVGCEKITITRGKYGMTYYEEGRYFHFPIINDRKVVDTIGAGDAVFSITSLLSQKKISGEILPFIGNSVGTLAVGVLGNKRPISKLELIDFINEYLP